MCFVSVWVWRRFREPDDVWGMGRMSLDDGWVLGECKGNRC